MTHWKEDHVQFIRENAGKMTDAAIALVVGRTRIAVASKRQHMGMVKDHRGTVEVGQARTILDREPVSDKYFNVREFPCWLTGIKR